MTTPKNQQDWREHNRDQYNKGVSAWKRRNPDKARDTQFRLKYGITLAEYNQMLVDQDGGCAVCGRKETGHRKMAHFCVDHDHVTGAIRGLLCNSCNVALGAAGDSATRLRALADYLERSFSAVINASNTSEETNGH